MRMSKWSSPVPASLAVQVTSTDGLAKNSPAPGDVMLAVGPVVSMITSIEADALFPPPSHAVTWIVRVPSGRPVSVYDDSVAGTVIGVPTSEPVHVTVTVLTVKSVPEVGEVIVTVGGVVSGASPRSPSA